MRVTSSIKIQCCSVANTHTAAWERLTKYRVEWKKIWNSALYGTTLFTFMKRALPKQHPIIFVGMHILKTQGPHQSRGVHVRAMLACCFEKWLRAKGEHNNMQIKEVYSIEVWVWHTGCSPPRWWGVNQYNHFGISRALPCKAEDAPAWAPAAPPLGTHPAALGHQEIHLSQTEQPRCPPGARINKGHSNPIMENYTAVKIKCLPVSVY